MFSILWRFIFISIVSSFLALGFIKLYVWRHSSACAMTFMYQNPEYIPIPINDALTREFPNYRLWLYGEGDYSQKLKSQNYAFNGIPVLFIPGNSGSYKQVRSLASVSLTKSANKQSQVHFNYFALDFNEVGFLSTSSLTNGSRQYNEFSACYGGSVYQETKFVAGCIDDILRLYSTLASPPTSVIIVGHSMGGVIATAVLTLPGFDSSKIRVIYTLGSPHLKPVTIPDLDILQYYQEIASRWEQRAQDVNVVSIGGGVADEMVKSELISLPVNTTKNIVVQSTAIPYVWSSADHLCLLWCNQLVRSIVRSMFHLVNAETLQIESDPQRRQHILEEHFVSGVSKSQRMSTYSSIAASDDWKTLPGSKVLSFDGSKMKTAGNALLVPIVWGNDMVIITKNVNLDKWIYICPILNIKNFTFECDPFYDLSSYSLYLPSFNSPLAKVAHIDRMPLYGQNHVAIFLPSQHRNDIKVLAESFNLTERRWNISLTLFDVWGSKEIIFPEKITFASILLHNFNSPWLTFKATIKPNKQSCKAYSHFSVPWSREDTYNTILKQATIHTLRLIVSKKNAGSPSLNLYLDPNCAYHLLLEFSPIDTVEQVVRRHWLQMPMFLAACLFQTLAHQFYSIATKGECSSAWKTLSLSRIFRNVITLQIVAFVYGQFEQYLDQLPSLSLLYKQDLLESSLVLWFMYVSIAAVGNTLVVIITLAVLVCAKFAVLILSILGLNEKTKKSEKGVSWSYSTAVAVGVAAVALYTAHATTGLLVVFFIHLGAIFKTWCSFVRMFGADCTSKEYRKITSSARLNISISLLWIGLLLSFGPEFAFWLRHLRWSWHLSPDPSFIPAVIAIVAFISQQPFSLNEKNSWIYNWLSTIHNCLSLLVLLLGVEYLFLVVWMLALDALLISISFSMAKNIEDLQNKKQEMVNDGKRSLNAWSQLMK